MAEQNNLVRRRHVTLPIMHANFPLRDRKILETKRPSSAQS